MTDALLAFATDAVREAGRLQLVRAGASLRVTEKSFANIVTEADIEIEAMFRARVVAHFPDHGVLGEELAEARSSGHGPAIRWLFDPIDGTANYARGLPFFCASLACEIDGTIELGAVFEPVRGELFAAVRGGGASLDGRPMAVSRTERLADALVGTGFPHNATTRVGPMEEAIATFAIRSRGVRRLGSAALDLSYVAAGRMDAFYDAHLKPWDTAAGALIVAEAGGRVTGTAGGTFSCHDGDVLASNGRIHAAALEILQAR